METSRSGESPSRFPSSALPWTLIRSTLPCGEWASSCANSRPEQPRAIANKRAECRRFIGNPHLLHIPWHVHHCDALSALEIQERLHRGAALVVKRGVIGRA